MSFESAGQFLFTAAKKYQLQDQAVASLICEKIRGFLGERFPERVEEWLPTKFQEGVLSIQVQNSASRSELFLHTHQLIEDFKTLDLPTEITEIRIVK